MRWVRVCTCFVCAPSVLNRLPRTLLVRVTISRTGHCTPWQLSCARAPCASAHRSQVSFRGLALVVARADAAAALPHARRAVGLVLGVRHLLERLVLDARTVAAAARRARARRRLEAEAPREVVHVERVAVDRHLAVPRRAAAPAARQALHEAVDRRHHQLLSLKVGERHRGASLRARGGAMGVSEVARRESGRVGGCG